MKKPVKSAPLLIALGVILLTSLARWLQPDFLERLEVMTYDMRAREALRFAPSVANNLGFLYIDETTLARVHDGSLGFRYGLYWPRQVYGRIIEELAAEGVRACAVDVIFGDLRPDHPSVQMSDGVTFMDSDAFFALQMQRASNVILAVTKDVMPPPLFLTNACALGDITVEKDLDGVLRRAKAFRMYRQWHPAFQQLESDPAYGVDLARARVGETNIILPQANGDEINIPLDGGGNFDLADFAGEHLPPGMARRARPFTEVRVWNMGIVLAAQALGLDLGKAEVDLAHGWIVLRRPGGSQRTIPVDAHGYFYIDWCLTPNDPRLTREPVHEVLLRDRLRIQGTNGLAAPWTGKLAVLGSAVSGNDLTDRGATPLRADTLLASKHWNVANAILTNRFVWRTPVWLDLVIIALLSALAAVLTWKPRILVGSTAMGLLMVAYVGFASILYFQQRCWIPIVLPLVGAVLTTHLCLVTWRVVFEQADKRRVKSVLSTIVSPTVRDELLRAERLELGGTRREITVLFADVRGFTEFTDASQERTAAFVREDKLTGEAADAAFDGQAKETLATINRYLSLVANTVLSHDAALDKFIGDCVMAFWGAPKLNPTHALACVRAAIEAQCAIARLNDQRQMDNQKIEAENRARAAAGLRPKPLLPLLQLGTGINTGLATVGLMGTEVQAVVRQGNYTVFGREVNLASRLEGASGKGRIFIGETTFEHLRRDDPELAATCVPLPPLKVKGFSTEVKAYEVPWKRAVDGGEDPDR